MKADATLPRREYVHHSSTTINYIKRNYDNYTIPEMAQQLGMDPDKIRALARREGIKKKKSHF